MVRANDIGNGALAVASGFLAYAAATADLKLAGIALSLGMAIKAIGSYIQDHYQDAPKQASP
jgi:hypothetical protein